MDAGAFGIAPRDDSGGVLAAIGGTPLLTLRRMGRRHGTVHAKAEFLQPGGSVKDRAALAAIRSARESGELRPGALVVEATSGNAGAGLAVVCAVLGHPFVAVMSRGNDVERAAMMRALGAEVVLVDQVDGIVGEVTGADFQAVEDHGRRLAAAESGFFVDQFRNLAMISAHESGTGSEILAQLDGAPDGFVACVGTGGTFVGVSRCLKRRYPNIHCAAVEPLGAAVLGGGLVSKPRHRLQGSGYGKVPPHWDPRLMDSSIAVSDDEARQYRIDLARLEGLHVGYTAAANVCAAEKLLASGALRPNAQVVTILCDTGLKYRD